MKFNVPTKLTFLRLFLAVVIIILLLFPFYRIGFSFKTFLIFGNNSTQTGQLFLPI